MAIEQFANAASTTLAAAITGVGDVTCTVTSAALFPTTGNFRILIESEILLVLAVSGADFTIARGQEGTAAATHPIGATVTQIVTARSIAIAGLSALTGRPFAAAPPTTGWTWVNQGTATTGSAGYGIYLYAPASTGRWRILTRPAPATPYTVTAVVRGAQPTTSSSIVGILFREAATGEIHSFGRTQAGAIQSTKWTNETTYSADYVTAYTPLGLDVMVLRIADTGVNRVCSVSADGTNFVTVHSVSRTDFLTADQIGIGIYMNQSSFDVGLSLLDWSVE